jgi:predicted permease
VFSTLTKTRLPADDIVSTSLATALCLILSGLVAWVGLRRAGLSAKVYLPSLTFPNIGNLGLPVCLFAFGERGLALAMIFFAVTAVAQFTIGPAIACGQFQPGRLLKVPFVYAVALSLAVRGLDLTVPRWIENTASLAGQVTVPLMLMALGVALAELRAASLTRATVLSVARLALGLAGGWAVATLLGLEGVQRGVVIVENAMPVAVFNYLFARMYDNQPEEVAGMVLVSTVLAYLGLPLLVAMVT